MYSMSRRGTSQGSVLGFLKLLVVESAKPIKLWQYAMVCIYQVYGNWHEDYGYMQKMAMKLTNLDGTFCRSVGHVDKDCRAYDILQEIKMDTYYVKREYHRMTQ